MNNPLTILFVFVKYMYVLVLATTSGTFIRVALIYATHYVFEPNVADAIATLSEKYPYKLFGSGDYCQVSCKLQSMFSI